MITDLTKIPSSHLEKLLFTALEDAEIAKFCGRGDVPARKRREALSRAKEIRAEIGRRNAK